MWEINQPGVWRVGGSSKGARLMKAAMLFLVCAVSPHVFAQHQHTHEHHAAEKQEARGQPTESGQQAMTPGRPGVIEMGSVRLEIPDPEVLDQDGRKVRFYSDLIKDKVVVVSFFFTKCTIVCPPQTGALVKLQTRLGERLGKDVFFVSVTRDPETDTPQHLKRWGEAVGVRRGWTLVTGDEGVMSRLVSDFTGENLGQQMHNSILLIGNERAGVWTSAEALSGTERLLEIIERVNGRTYVRGHYRSAPRRRN